MKHFIVTRFNLKNTNWKNSRDGEKVLTAHWLKHRFNLFETYCLPSVQNQTNQNFNWLVFFDIETPEVYKQKIESLALSYSNFRPVYSNGLHELDTELKSKIESSITENDTFIITTRLDNDDIIHKNFIKTIQDLFIPKAKTIIDLRLGYQFILKKENPEYRVFKSAFNPFLSLIDSVKDFETVISKEHHYWKSNSNKIINTKTPLWIQIVHDKNMVARKNRDFKKIEGINADDFGCTLPKSIDSRFSIFMTNFLGFPFRVFVGLKTRVKTLF